MDTAEPKGLAMKKEYPVYICNHIFDKTRDVLLVCKEDGDLQFLCGQGDHNSDDVHVVGLNHLIERDPSLKEVLDIDEGFEAERDKINGEWSISRIDVD